MTKFKNLGFTLMARINFLRGLTVRPINGVNSFLTKMPFTVIFIGNDGDYLLFRVIVNSDKANSSSFQIFDRAAGAIYSANINYTHEVQNFKIEKRDNQKLDFKFVVGKDVYSRSFAIL